MFVNKLHVFSDLKRGTLGFIRYCGIELFSCGIVSSRAIWGFSSFQLTVKEGPLRYYSTVYLRSLVSKQINIRYEKNKMAFVGILSQKKLLFGLLVIQLVWYILINNYSPQSR